MRDFVNPMLETWAGRAIGIFIVIVLLVIGAYWVRYYTSQEKETEEIMAPAESAATQK